MLLLGASICRLELKITGIVQGVGFRPYIYQLAHTHNLSGFILNDGDGVVIEIEGDEKSISNFQKALKNSAPVLSRIDFIASKKLDLKNTHEFVILQSNQTKISTMLSADISMCDDCKLEMQDENNRRYNYPFINCTNCGPRYSIITNLPYDRDATSMSIFEMCSECRDEYENPNDRRYHAQPISCFKCGPKLKFASIEGDEEIDEQKAIKKICMLIKSGQTVGIKGLGGFHIVCDASNEEAVLELRLNKSRPTKPFAVMFTDIDAIKKVCSLTQKDEELILSKERPIVIVTKKSPIALADSVAPNIDKIGVFLPYTPLHEILLKELSIPLIATSANLSDEPIIRDEKELFSKMPKVIKNVLTHDREIVNACDDSVVLNSSTQTIMLRMARGYAPQSFYLEKKLSKSILALGANQKSTITIAFDNNIVISPHIGDLNSIEAFEYFKTTLETLQRVYKFEPDVIVCDKHTGYETTIWAKEYVKEHKNIELLEVQHHFSHALACMAEYSLDEDVLAFCFDGTGYGDDGKLWGGEVFVASPQKYKRVYHFLELSLLGGEKAIKEPKRVALSLLFEIFSLKEILCMECEFLKLFSHQEIKIFHNMYTKGINTPKTSSLGRVFDGVCALSGDGRNLGYEGESGLILETQSKDSLSDAIYSYTLENGVINYKEMIAQILKEADKIDIAKKFISTITNIILDITKEYPTLPVVLSGGVFQNATLVSQVTQALKEMNREYYLQSKTPVNDGGISLGQAYYAINKKDS